jgi:hypothetical protein
MFSFTRVSAFSPLQMEQFWHTYETVPLNTQYVMKSVFCFDKRILKINILGTLWVWTIRNCNIYIVVGCNSAFVSKFWLPGEYWNSYYYRERVKTCIYLRWIVSNHLFYGQKFVSLIQGNSFKMQLKQQSHTIVQKLKQRLFSLVMNSSNFPCDAWVSISLVAGLPFLSFVQKLCRFKHFSKHKVCSFSNIALHQNCTLLFEKNLAICALDKEVWNKTMILMSPVSLHMLF